MTEIFNDAVAYGVRIVEAQVAPGADYWKVVRVHHLSPPENNGRHHIFIEAQDANGSRQYGAKMLVRWIGDSHAVSIDKQPPDPGANEPMWKWQVYQVEAQGLPSDRVENLRSDHPDEAPGNTLFHHSFHITFQRATASAPVAAQSVIRGRAPGGAGHTVKLLAISAADGPTTQVGLDENYRFENLVAGQYLLKDLNDGREAGPIAVDGKNEVTADFPSPGIAAKALTHYVLFGSARLALTQLQLSLVADYLASTNYAFGFAPADAAKASRVILVGEQPEDVRKLLAAARCEIVQLPADPGALLAAVRAA